MSFCFPFERDLSGLFIWEKLNQIWATSMVNTFTELFWSFHCIFMKRPATFCYQAEFQSGFWKEWNFQQESLTSHLILVSGAL